MSKKSKIEAVLISEDIDFADFDWEGAKVRVPKEVKKHFENALNKKLPFSFRLKQFLAGESKAGKQAKILKDFALIFFPWGDKVEKITELIAHQIKRTMPETKSKTSSKTIITFSLLLIVSILMHFGIDLGLEITPDAAWLTTATSIVGIILRLVTKKPVELGEITKTLLRQKEE